MDDAMLYSVELRLTAGRASGPSRVTGHHLYAFFLRLLEGVNHILSTHLHDEEGPKPFTISPPASLDPGERRPLSREGSRAWVRITLLQEEVFASLIDAIWRLPPERSLPLGEAWVICDALLTTPAQSPCAGVASFQELLEGAGKERKLRLAFLSPTTFRSKGERNILFPEPSLVFGSLLTRWNAFSSPALALDLGEAHTGGVRVSAYRLSTRMLDFGSYGELGFLGQAAYEGDEGLPQSQVRALNALAAFAFYSGVGAKTTMGMGQCRRIEYARPLPHRAGRYPEEGWRPADSN